MQRSQTAAERLPARNLSLAELDLGRDRDERGQEDAGRVRKADRADLELALLLRALRVRAGRVVLLLVDAVEDVHTAGRAHVSVRIILSERKGRKEGDSLCEAAADALYADEQEDEGEAESLVLVAEYTNRGLERERREDEALDDRGERE